ncbi:hypothetical protein U1Q18_019159 [Sarracenia purpurea var. burkii]
MKEEKSSKFFDPMENGEVVERDKRIEVKAAHFDMVSKPYHHGPRQDELHTQGGASQICTTKGCTCSNREPLIFQRLTMSKGLRLKVNLYNHDKEELMEGITGKLHYLPKDFSSSLRLARLGELDELANVSHVAESGSGPNHLRLSYHANHETVEVETSNMSKVGGNPRAESPALATPFSAQVNEGVSFSNSSDICIRSVELEALNKIMDRMVVPREMNCGEGSYFHKNGKSTCEAAVKDPGPVSLAKK